MIDRGDARSRAAALIERHVGVFPDLIPIRPEDRGLSSRDAALMHAILDAAIRRWTTIEHLIGQASSRPVVELEAGVRAALLAGAAQLLFLDRLPDHAVLNETVEWVKRWVGSRATGIVNALLRRIISMRSLELDGSRTIRDRWTALGDELPLSDGRAIALRGVTLPASESARTAVATGVSAWTVNRWAWRLGAEESRRLAWHALAAPPVIINAMHAPGVPEYPLAHGGTLTLRPHRREGHFVVEGPHAALEEFLAARPEIWVQDPSSSEAAWSVRDRRPSLIVDWCAGQGTKTRQLAAMFPQARILATDVDESRARTLAQVFAGHRRVSAMSAEEIEREAAGRADLILLDVPCGNSGVLARRVEARHRACDAQLARLVAIQESILSRCRPLLAPGGAMLYATCSLEPEENERLVERAAGSLGLKIAHLRRTSPAGGPGLPATDYTDGSFSAVLTS